MLPSTHPSQSPTFRRMVCDIEALAWMMMVAVLSSRISLRSGVGSRVSSSIRTESVSLEIRNCRRSFSRFKRPGGGKGGRPLGSAELPPQMLGQTGRHMVIQAGGSSDPVLGMSLSPKQVSLPLGLQLCHLTMRSTQKLPPAPQ